MPICPRCDGSGKTGPVHINRGSKPHEWRSEMACDFCGGAGKISEDQADAMKLGKAFRERRVARDESLREAAKRLGMKASELSALERGRGGMAAWHHPWATHAYLEATN